MSVLGHDDREISYDDSVLLGCTDLMRRRVWGIPGVRCGEDATPGVITTGDLAILCRLGYSSKASGSNYNQI
jgi:hypothetical protein